LEGEEGGPEGMGLTPLEIYQMEFTKGFRGYEPAEVEEFKKTVGKDYEGLAQENRKLKDEVARLKEQMKDYIEKEKNMSQAMVAAQKTSGEIKMHAEKEAELIIKQAEMNSEKMIEDARLEARDILREIHSLKKQRKMLRIELRNVLDSFYAVLNIDQENSPDSGPNTPQRKKSARKRAVKKAGSHSKS